MADNKPLRSLSLTSDTLHEAMICTYCINCVENVLMNLCPNCGGGFEKRPTMPKEQLQKHPPREDKVLKPVNQKTFIRYLTKTKILTLGIDDER